MRKELEQYQVDNELLWEGMPARGLDGYGVIQLVEDHYHWEAIGDWGEKGYNLGRWPLIIIFWRDRNGLYDVIEYVEGDATTYACPSKLIRCQITDEIAYFHWRHLDEDWTHSYHFIENLPLEFKGPYNDMERAEWLRDLEAEKKEE